MKQFRFRLRCRDAGTGVKIVSHFKSRLIIFLNFHDWGAIFQIFWRLLTMIECLLKRRSIPKLICIITKSGTKMLWKQYSEERSQLSHWIFLILTKQFLHRHFLKHLQNCFWYKCWLLKITFFCGLGGSWI